MKRILLYIFLLTFVGIASAQISIPESGWMSLSTPNNQSAGGAIIRARNPAEAITYFEVNDVGYFSRVGIGSTIGRIKLEPKYHIKDFRIADGDYILFCGYYSGYIQYYEDGVLMTKPREEGILGYIKINDIDSSNIGDTTISYHIIKDSNISRINRMVAYRTPTTSYQVVAIADSFYNVSSILRSEQKIISCDMQDMIANGNCSFEIISSETLGGMGYAHDIVVTANYVATIGYHHAFGANNISIRRCNRLNVNTGDLAVVMYYPFTSMENLSYIHACAIDGDNIAVAYGAPGTVDNTYYMRARFINIENFTMFNSQEYDVRCKMEPTEMTYLLPHRSVVLLHDCDDDRCYSSFNFLLPDKYLPYTYNRIYDTSFRWSSLDELIDECCVAAVGNSCFMKSGTTASANGCYNYDRLNVKIINNVEPMGGTKNLSVKQYSGGNPFILENVAKGSVLLPGCRNNNP